MPQRSSPYPEQMFSESCASSDFNQLRLMKADLLEDCWPGIIYLEAPRIPNRQQTQTVALVSIEGSRRWMYLCL